MEFNNSLKIKSDYIEDLLKKYMPKEDGYQSTIMEAMNYSLKAGGKRLRPILTLEACKVVGGNEEDAARPGSAPRECPKSVPST